MTTPPIELAATVERVEIPPDPPEPTGWLAIYYVPRDEGWRASRGYFSEEKSDALDDLERGIDPRMVRLISPAPSPAETGAPSGTDYLDKLREEGLREIRRKWPMPSDSPAETGAVREFNCPECKAPLFTREPAETGAVPVEEIEKIFEFAANRAEAMSESPSYNMKQRGEQILGLLINVRAWLATQKGTR